MDEQAVREHAMALCDAVVAGDIGAATQDFSDELRHNLGEVIVLLPLPATEAAIESMAHSPSGYGVVIRVVGDSQEVTLQTRWKDRDGKPTLVELSHLSAAELAPAEPEGDGAEAGEDAG